VQSSTVKKEKCVLIVVLSAALNFLAAGFFAEGAEQKAPKSKVEKQITRPEKKSKENADAEWFADPERGWVRVDDRPGAKDDQKKTKQTAGKQKPKSTETVRQ
jgi:hypothetical protein